MTDTQDLIQPDRGQDATAIHLTTAGAYEDFAKSLCCRAACEPKRAESSKVPRGRSGSYPMATIGLRSAELPILMR